MKLVINHVSNSGQWWIMPKRFSGIITHYINSSVWKNSLAGTNNHTQLLQYLHTKTITVKGSRQ